MTKSLITGASKSLSNLSNTNLLLILNLTQLINNPTHQVINHSLGTHLQLTQVQIRNLVCSEPTIQNMLSVDHTIGLPAYDYIQQEAVAESLEELAKKLENRGSNG